MPEETMVNEQHLSAEDIASYVDRTVSEERQSRILAHLARCAACRDEVVDVSRVVVAPVGARWRAQRVLLPAAAAAALLLVWVGAERATPRDPVVHRDEFVTQVSAPRPLAPVGLVDGPTRFAWTPVAYAEGYRVRLFDRDGAMLWEHVAADTTAAVPSSAVLRPGSAYFWKVEARWGFDRWAASDLVEFELRRAPPP